MQVDKNFYKLLENFEKFVSCPYLDSKGIPTIGIGTTFYPDGRRVTMKDPCITRAEAEELVRIYMDTTQKLVDALTPDTITQNQFNSLCSLTYNIGDFGFKNSTLLKKVRANPNDPSIRSEFLKWVNSGGKMVPGLVNRRVKEAQLYFTP